MGLRAWLKGALQSPIADEYKLSGRWLPRTTNGIYTPVVNTLATSPGGNRTKGLILTRTGTGLATLTVLNDPLTAGGVNLTPQVLTQMPAFSFLDSVATNQWLASVLTYAWTSGVLTFTVQFSIASAPTTAADPPVATAEIGCTFWGSSNTVA